MKHVLVIGGTGMLANASVWLSEKNDVVSVVGRTKQKMDQLVKKSTNIKPIQIDYQDVVTFRQKLKEAMASYGPIDLVVSWIHRVPANPLKMVMEEVSKQSSNWDLYHVLGSSAKLEDIKEKIEVPEGCNYHQVQLGFILKEENSRWLTHEEISEGVIQAIKQRKRIHIVGQLEPWDRRP